jgi:type II secretory pathway pseudopilin PulG
VKFQRKKKSLLTLLEVMIVIFLIGLIGSVIGYNMKGGLDKGKVFKSEQAAAKIRDILLMAVSEGAPIADVQKNPQQYLEDSGLCKDADKLLKDGWGKDFVITTNGEDIDVVSPGYQAYLQKK